MPYSYSSYTGTGSQTNFAIAFDYLADTVVVGVIPEGILVYVDDVKQTSGYSIVGSDVVFGSAPADGASVLLLRSTPRGKSDRLVDFADATVLTEDQLDTSALQLLYIAQEAFEQSTSGGSATPTYLPYSAALGAWDAESQQVARVATPTSGTDAVNKTYVDDGFLPWDGTAGTYDASRSGADKRIDGVLDPAGNQQAATKKYVDDVATWGIAGVPQAFKFTADGATNSFTLTGAPYAEAAMLVVGLDGVLQLPADDYTVIGGATNSELVFVSYTPADGQIINVLNFGKARFLDSAVLDDDSVTTAMLQDAAVTTAKLGDASVTTAKLVDANVTTGKLADASVTTAKLEDASVTAAKLGTDAVTEAKIADSSVDYARLKNTDFLSSANASSTAQVLRVDAGSADLTTGTLAAADISNFNAAVTATPVSSLAAATAAVNMNSQFITNLPDPTSAQHAATKAYVDVSTQSAMRGTLITDYTLASNTGQFDVTGWFDDSKYLWYEFVCMNFAISDTSNGYVALFARNSTGTYLTTSGSYATRPIHDGAAQPSSPSTHMPATPVLIAGLTWRYNWKITIMNNTTSAPYKKNILSEGGILGNTIRLFQHHGWLANSTTTITGLRFMCSDGSSSASGSIYSGARVLVYGYEGL